MIGTRSLELTKLRHRSAPQESSRVPKSPHGSAHPKGGIGFDDVDDALLDSVYASGDERRRLLPRCPDAEHALSGPTRRTARTRFAPGNERRRLLAVEPSTARPDPARPSPPRSEDFCMGDLLHFSA
ncbi:unnamed protein product [Sphagnum balticum]